LSSKPPAQVDRRLLLLWDEDPGPPTTPTQRSQYFVGLDCYTGSGVVVVGRCYGYSRLEVIAVRVWHYNSVRDFADQLRSLKREYPFTAAYMDVLSVYQPIVDIVQGAISPRLTKSVRNQIHARVRTFVSYGTLDVVPNPPLTDPISRVEQIIRDHRSASENEPDATCSYNDALGLMVWSFDEARNHAEALRP